MPTRYTWVYLGIPKSNIQHWDRNSNFHFKPSKRRTQRSYREIGPGAGILTTRRIFLARPQACRSSILMTVLSFTAKENSNKNGAHMQTTARILMHYSELRLYLTDAQASPDRVTHGQKYLIFCYT